MGFTKGVRMKAKELIKKLKNEESEEFSLWRCDRCGEDTEVKE